MDNCDNTKDENQNRGEERMSDRALRWALFFVILIISAITVPFIFLQSTFKIYGAFLFWLLFAVIAIISVGFITNSWRD